MKRFLQIFSTTLVLVVLCGCHKTSQPKNNGFNSAATTAVSITTVSSSENELDVLKEQYRGVFEDYQKIYELSTTYSTTSIDINAEIEQFNVPITLASVENSLTSPRELRYAFYDLDGNGQQELFIGSLQRDGSVYIKGMYYLDSGHPEILGEAYIGSASARGGVSYYGDGHVLHVDWSPGRGAAFGVLYQLQADNTKAVEITKRDDFRIPDPGGPTNEDLFGVSDSLLVDGSTFDWTEFDFLEQTIKTSSSVESNIFPEELIGIWVGYTQSANFAPAGSEVTLVFSEDGSVHTTLRAPDGSEVYYDATVQVGSVELVGEQLYRYHGTESDGRPVMLIPTQIGGINVKYASGFMLEDGKYHDWGWQARTDEDFIYTYPTDEYSTTLYKQ